MAMEDETLGGLGIWYRHRVSYGETDTMGVMYYAQYFYLFERGRNEIIRASGHSYKDVERQGLFLPACEAHCRYRSPARYDDLLDLHVWVTDWKHASFVFRYELFNEEQSRMLADGYTKHAFVNSKGRPVAVPDWFRDLFILKAE